MRVVVWGKQAEACNKYLTKGSPVFVEGRLQYHSWEGQDGQKKSTLEIRADRVQFLGRGRAPEQTAEPQTAEPQTAEAAVEPFLPDDDFGSQDERDLT